MIKPLNGGRRSVYGGALSYYPTADWTLIGTVDRTINIVVTSVGDEFGADGPGIDCRPSSIDCFNANYINSAAIQLSDYAAMVRKLLICVHVASNTSEVRELDNSWCARCDTQIQHLAEHVVDVGVSLYKHFIQCASRECNQ